jgi:hypothetical protein
MADNASGKEAVNYANQSPEDYGDMANTLSKILANAFMKSENMLPVKVVSYDRVKNTAIVQPLIKIIMTGGVYSRGQIGPIPVFAAGAGQFVMNFPVKPGDLGWILANDRDISQFEQTLEEGPPPTTRTHSFNDSVLFPDAIRNFDTTGEDGNMVIQSLDGKIRISLGESQLKLSHPTKIFLDAPLVEMQKDAHAPGTITGDTDVVFAGISGKGHKHDGAGLNAPNGPVTGTTSNPPHN